MKAFAAIWVGFLSIIWFIGLTNWISRGAPTRGDAVMLLLAPMGMICFGAGLLAFGRWLARDELPFLLAFVRETLEADLVEEAR